MNLRIILVFILVSTLLSCTKEDAKLSLSITPSTLDINSGDAVDFKIDGDADFLVYYSGLDGQKHEEYPKAGAESINMQAEEPSFSFTYNLHGSVKAAFVASSYGNWSEERLDKIIEFTINVVDNNTDVKSATVKTPGLFGEKFEGVIDKTNATITVTMPEGSKIDKLTTNLVPESSLAKISMDGNPYVNNSQLDFSTTGSKIFSVTAVGGKVTEWTMKIKEK